MAPWMTLQTLALVLDGIAAVAVIAWLWWARKRLAADTATAREQADWFRKHLPANAEQAAMWHAEAEALAAKV